MPPAHPNVNVVKPLRHDDEDDSPEPGAPRTFLDPKFSRALDFKLRRLKEKETLQANLRRPTRVRRAALAASCPDVSAQRPPAPGAPLSRSHQRIDDVHGDERAPPEGGGSPGGRGRSRADPDKPRFMTTVKCGQFLPPPPELARALGLETLYPSRDRERLVYSYSSRPKAVAPRSARSPPVGAAPAGARRHAAQLFGRVRALAAGVAGLAHHQHTGAGGGGGGGGGAAPYSNVMHDKRVVRGSTFATHAHAHAAGDGGAGAESAAKARRRALARRAAARLRPASPPAAPGRRHLPVQTDHYLEELAERGAELEVGVQVALAPARPASPRYVRARTGTDAHTQVYPGELFDFDVEVQPILEVLVGKTTEQALAEVAQEEELAALREQQRRYCELRDAELAERQRLAAQHLRLHREKELRAAEACEAQAAARGARERAAAAALVQGYVRELLPAVLAGLRQRGYLRDRALTGVDEEFMPWLLDEVVGEMEALITSRDLITEIVRDAVEARAERLRDDVEMGAEGAASACDTPAPSVEPAGEAEGEAEGEAARE